MSKSKLEQAISAIKAGDKKQGRQLLVEVLREEPRNARAWLWMSAVVDDPERRSQSLLTVLEIDPENELAKKGLAKFGWVGDDVPASGAPHRNAEEDAYVAPAREHETRNASVLLEPNARAIAAPEEQQEAERWLRRAKLK